MSADDGFDDHPEDDSYETDSGPEDGRPAPLQFNALDDLGDDSDDQVLADRSPVPRRGSGSGRTAAIRPTRYSDDEGDEDAPPAPRILGRRRARPGVSRSRDRAADVDDAVDEVVESTSPRRPRRRRVRQPRGQIRVRTRRPVPIRETELEEPSEPSGAPSRTRSPARRVRREEPAAVAAELAGEGSGEDEIGDDLEDIGPPIRHRPDRLRPDKRRPDAAGLVFVSVDPSDMYGAEVPEEGGDDAAAGDRRRFHDDMPLEPPPARSTRQAGVFVQNPKTGRFRHLKSMKDAQRAVPQKEDENVESTDVQRSAQLAEMYSRFPSHVATLLLGFFRLLTGLLAGMALLFIIVIYVPFSSFGEASFLSFYAPRGETVQKFLFTLVTMGFVCSVYVSVVRYKESNPFQRLIYILQSLLYVVTYVASLVCASAEDYFATHDMAVASSKTDTYFYVWHVMNGIRNEFKSGGIITQELQRNKNKKIEFLVVPSAEKGMTIPATDSRPHLTSIRPA